MAKNENAVISSLQFIFVIISFRAGLVVGVICAEARVRAPAQKIVLRSPDSQLSRTLFPLHWRCTDYFLPQSLLEVYYQDL